MLVAAMMIVAGGCPPRDNPVVIDKPPGGATWLAALHFDDPLRGVTYEAPVRISAARNETTYFAVQIAPPAGDAKGYSLRIAPPQVAKKAAVAITAYQVVSMPVNVNRAGYVRHTGLPATTGQLPRALLPLKADNNAVALPARPAADFAAPVGPAQVWVDVFVPPATPAGQYKMSCELLQGGKAVATLPVEITVYDFALPEERHLLMAGQVEWSSLVQLYPEQFEAVTTNLLSRREPKYAPAIKTLDQLVAMAQAHRMQLVIPALQPIVKWPSDQPPQVDWQEFDSVVSPWMKGEAFADRVPLGYWPLPSINWLNTYNRTAQLAYWSAAASHFDQLNWLGRSAAPVQRRAAGKISAAEADQLSAETAQVLGIHPRLRAIVPMEEEQVELAGQANRQLIDPRDLNRLMYAAQGLVFAPPAQRLPKNDAARWLRTDLAGLVPYIGAGADEREVRLWAWLAFLRSAQLIEWGSPLPGNADARRPAGPEELVWFYPGSWFGVDQPVPTMQLKWLRRAEQDYEYLWLAQQRGRVTHALVMARLITKPVEIQPTQSPDPVYTLMCGTSDTKVWQEGLRLLARAIVLGLPATRPSDDTELGVQTMQWISPQERPLLLGRSTEWSLTPGARNSTDLSLKLGIDVYNAADQRPDKNKVEWTGVPPAWQIDPKPKEVPELATYAVRRMSLDARVEGGRITPSSRKPVDVTFTDGFSGRRTLLRLVTPVAYCEQREGVAPVLDGSMEDWAGPELIHEGPLVQMLNRPALQRQELQWATTKSSLYSAWATRQFYLGFRVEGVSGGAGAAEKSFVDYQFRRAWGEDLCEALIQAVYADNSTGPVMHVVAKPRGQIQVERRVDATTWAPAAGAADVRYAATIKDAVWRGEMSIPWEVIGDSAHAGTRPVALRFNFTQHRDAAGESASWAGPVDFGRDDAFVGLLLLHATQAMAPAPGN